MKNIDTMTLDEINAELPPHFHKKRIDYARNMLTKYRAEQPVKVEKEELKHRPTAQDKWKEFLATEYKWQESQYEGRQVYVSGRTAEILHETQAPVDGKTVRLFLVQIRGSDQTRVVPLEKIRFKAVKDEYRDGYVTVDSQQTESGGKPIHNGDLIGQVMAGLFRSEVERVAQENGFSTRYEGWAAKGANNGMLRMHTSNVLRAIHRAGKPFSILGETDIEKMQEAATTRNLTRSN